MNDKERFESEIEKRLSSELWDSGISASVVRMAAARRRKRFVFAGGAAAVFAAAAVTIALSAGSGKTKSEAETIVMQKVNGAYVSSAG